MWGWGKHSGRRRLCNVHPWLFPAWLKLSSTRCPPSQGGSKARVSGPQLSHVEFRESNIQRGRERSHVCASAIWENVRWVGANFPSSHPQGLDFDETEISRVDDEGMLDGNAGWLEVAVLGKQSFPRGPAQRRALGGTAIIAGWVCGIWDQRRPVPRSSGSHRTTWRKGWEVFVGQSRFI